MFQEQGLDSRLGTSSYHGGGDIYHEEGSVVATEEGYGQYEEYYGEEYCGEASADSRVGILYHSGMNIILIMGVFLNILIFNYIHPCCANAAKTQICSQFYQFLKIEWRRIQCLGSTD